MKVLFDNNSRIRKYFTFVSDEAPVEELKYVIQNKVNFSFINEVSSIVERATLKAEKRRIKVKSFNLTRDNYRNFLVLASNGIQMNDDQKLEEALESLRSIYDSSMNVLNI